MPTHSGQDVPLSSRSTMVTSLSRPSGRMNVDPLIICKVVASGSNSEEVERSDGEKTLGMMWSYSYDSNHADLEISSRISSTDVLGSYPTSDSAKCDRYALHHRKTHSWLDSRALSLFVKRVTVTQAHRRP